MALHASPCWEMPRAHVSQCLQCPSAFSFPPESAGWGNKGEKEAAATTGEQNLRGSCWNQTESIAPRKGLGWGHGPILGLPWGFCTSMLKSAPSSPGKWGCRSWEWEREQWPSRGDGSCREFTGNTKTNSLRKKKKKGGGGERNQRDVEREIRGKTEQGDGGSGEDAGRGRQEERGGEAGAGGAVWRVPIASLHRGSPTSSSFSLRLE